MDQLAFKFDSDEIELFYQGGAMYAYAPGIPFKETSIELGDKTLCPGQFINKLGHKRRSSFEMTGGQYLRYVGKSGNFILFSVNDLDSDYYYAFGYVSKTALFIGNPHNRSGYDLRLEKLVVFDEIPDKT